MLESAVRSHQGHVGESIEYVFGHIVPVGPREVDVEVRRIAAVKVDKPIAAEPPKITFTSPALVSNAL